MAATKPIDKESGKVKICTGHVRPICHIEFSPVVDGTFWFVTSCHDAKPMIRNGETGDWVGTFEGHKGAVYCSSFNADATRVVTGSGDYTAIIWDALDGSALHTWQHPHYIKSNDWMGSKIITGNFDSHLRIFDATNYAAEPVKIAAYEKNTVKACYFVGNTDTVVCACEGLIKKFDLRSNSVVQQLDIPGLNVLEYTHVNNMCAAHGKSVTFVDPNTLTEVGTIATPEDVECASLSPDGKYVALGSRIKAKEYTLDGTEVENHRGHHGPIFHIRYSPDNMTFSSGSEDGMVRMWPTHNIISQLPE
jgi:serine-threonine kinase receptor-associated protein